MICKLLQQSDIKMANWSRPLRTFYPHRRFRISTTDYLKGSRSATIPRIVASPSSRWNISRYLLSTTRGLTKNSKDFQPLLRQVRHHTLSDSLEYWHLKPDFHREILCCLLEVSCSILNLIHPCHTAAILFRETKKALFYHAKPRNGNHGDEA